MLASAVSRAGKLIHAGGRVHLMGVGGIGMAGVARLLLARGFSVSGCDLQENRQTRWLSSCGVDVICGHDADHITPRVDWLIRSTAVSDSHPEVLRAVELGIPVSRRGEVLPALMRDRTCIAVSGTHGKTTTTAMIAQILGCGYCVGGEVDGFDGVAEEGAVMVVEADESDGTVAGYMPDYSVITNVEYDHMEHHASEAAFVGCFEQLIQNTKKKVYYCAGDPMAQKLCADNPKCDPFNFPEPRFSLPLPGDHNQWNAAAASAVAINWKSEEEIRQSIAGLQPVRRRFETVFDEQGIQIVSDYAHHPTEIAAVIQTAQTLNPKRLLAVFQPHRYTRTRALGPDFPPSFDGLDKLWMVPVYAASEAPLAGGTTHDLVKRFADEWTGHLFEFKTLESAWDAIRVELREGDLLLILGAGDIEKLAEQARDKKWCPGEEPNLHSRG